jgi:hypothetical protein
VIKWKKILLPERWQGTAGMDGKEWKNNVSDLYGSKK